MSQHEIDNIDRMISERQTELDRQPLIRLCLKQINSQIEDDS
jgi:hypothetical protein